MTTMARPSVLLLCVVMGLFTTVHSQRLKPLRDALEIATEVVIPCGSRCVVRSYREVLEATNTCVMVTTGLGMEIEQYLRVNNLNGNPTYQQIYDAMFSEGRSPLCRWYRTYGGCFEREFGRICGRGVMEALTGLIEDFDMLVCSQNPNYVACVTHPSLFGEIDTSGGIGTGPYVACASAFINNFMNIDEYDDYYNNVILRDNGVVLFRALSTFGNCMADAIKTVTVSPPTGCAVVEEDLRIYSRDAFNYLNFGQAGKDYVKCFSNPALHMDWEQCARDFETDLRAIYGASYLEQLNTTLFIGGYSALQRPYSNLSNCLKRGVNQNCRSEPDSVALVTRCLHPLDHLYGVRSDDPAFCSGPRSSVASVVLILCGLITFLCGLLRLH